jgi:acylphosphatase
MPQTVLIIVTGKVQGVFYRQHTKEKAIALGITGEVRNMPDDTVHITATGPAEQINQLITWCRQGPPKARVENVTAEEIALQVFDKFSILR